MNKKYKEKLGRCWELGTLLHLIKVIYLYDKNGIQKITKSFKSYCLSISLTLVKFCLILIK